MPLHEKTTTELRRRTREAIALAIESRWEEAVRANKDIIELFPTDIDTYNRLGRALTELGEYSQAKEAYQRTLELDPNNSIARKNFHRLSLLKGTTASSKSDYRKVAPQIFIGEEGKVGLVTLYNLAPQDVLAKMASGDEVFFKVRGHNLVIENSEGEYLGQVESKRQLRLLKLIEGGNKYTAAIATISGNGVRVIVKEIFQHPSQVGYPSFPPKKSTETFHPYVREIIMRHELEEEEIGGGEELEEDSEHLPEGFSLVEDAVLETEEEDIPGEE